MTIGDAAKASGINAKLIRHYESIGVIGKAKRSDGGYRQYSEQDLHILIFVRRARDLGFPMKEIKKLVSLWRNKSRASSDVKALALQHLQALEVKINQLDAMAKTLKELAKNCHGDERPHCPILGELSK